MGHSFRPALLDRTIHSPDGRVIFFAGKIQGLHDLWALGTASPFAEDQGGKRIIPEEFFYLLEEFLLRKHVALSKLLLGAGAGVGRLVNCVPHLIAVRACILQVGFKDWSFWPLSPLAPFGLDALNNPSKKPNKIDLLRLPLTSSIQDPEDRFTKNLSAIQAGNAPSETVRSPFRQAVQLYQFRFSQ
jgi:hypothetical protein